MELIKLTKNIAKNVFEKTPFYVYISIGPFQKNSFFTPICISGKMWDGSLNIYTRGLSPLEYGFNDIIGWIEERETLELEYYTLLSDKPIFLDNLED